MNKEISFLKKINNCWIWFWYCDITRLFFVLIPSYFVLLVPTLLLFNVPEEHFKSILMFTYIGVFLFALIDNDYSNLRKIGLNEYREKLK